VTSVEVEVKVTLSLLGFTCGTAFLLLPQEIESIRMLIIEVN
jgi:hypothetical protein